MLRLLATRGINDILIKTVAKPSVKNAMNIYQKILVANIGKLPREFFEHVYRSQSLPDSFKSFTSLLENVLTWRGWREELYIGDKLHQLQVPVRFIWGDRDAFEKPDSGMAKTKGIRDCHFKVIENAGHCPWLDQPKQCSEAILSMLTLTPAGASLLD